MWILYEITEYSPACSTEFEANLNIRDFHVHVQEMVHTSVQLVLDNAVMPELTRLR